VGCGARNDKPSMQRFVLVEGRLEPDPGQRRPGRGAYVCGRECAERALRRGGFQRSFRSAVRPDPDLVDSIV
jgi:predicted RNA-binding protein YlxR (DUF448 family)